MHLSLAAELSIGADLAGNPSDFRSECVELVHHPINGVLQLQDFALYIHCDLFGEVAVGHRGGHVGDVADLGSEVAGHKVDAVCKVFPGSPDSEHLRLTAKLSIGADLAGHTGDFGSE